jgi:hypothetical protein
VTAPLAGACRRIRYRRRDPGGRPRRAADLLTNVLSPLWFATPPSSSTACRCSRHITFAYGRNVFVNFPTTIYTPRAAAPNQV